MIRLLALLLTVLSDLAIPDGNMTFNGASLNGVIPEPGTAPLLGLGLVGRVLAGRRIRRS